MATQSPFLLLESLLRDVASKVQPPHWMIHEVQHRAVLLLNHVLMQEPVATQRLRGHVGQVVLVRWQSFEIRLAVTAAGLLDLAPHTTVPDLSLRVTEPSVAKLSQAVLRGDKPGVHIEGDVQLAAEVNWLVDHVRWDIEDDLARLLGDEPARVLGLMGRRLAEGLSRFVAPAKAEPAGPGTVP